MVAEVLEAVAVLGVIEALILNFPAAFGQAEQGAAADPVARKVGEIGRASCRERVSDTV